MQLYLRLCEATVREFLSRGIQKGCITLQLQDRDENKVLIFGEESSSDCRKATLRVERSQAFFARIAAGGDIGFSEAYMAGDFDIELEQLVQLFRIFIDNRDDSNSLGNSKLVLSWLGTWINKMVHKMNANTLDGAARNISAHYDLSNELFETFLGETWIYSCALFEPWNIDLDSAQRNKIESILKMARLDGDCSVLEIGCGWGELAISAAKQYGCKVIGITLSEQQLTFARERAKQCGVEDLVEFKKCDYRSLSDEEGMIFDRIISVEMLEAVGHEYLPSFFAHVQMMCKKDALIILQVITMPEDRYEEYKSTTDFIQKHIFPGGLCPSIEAIICAAAASGGFTLEYARNIAPHYAKTLREWRHRFVHSVKSGQVGNIGFGDEIFIRKWLYYLTYCEAGFASRTLGTMQMILSRPGNIDSGHEKVD